MLLLMGSAELSTSKQGFDRLFSRSASDFQTTFHPVTFCWHLLHYQLHDSPSQQLALT